MDLATLASTATTNAQTTAATRSLTANFDTFLTLLTAQLRNQNPLDPLDTDRFTEQLVQFSGVEQSIETNTRLDALIALQSGADRSSALGLIGRRVSIEGDNAANAGLGAEWSFTLPTAAARTDLSIVGPDGETVATLDGETTPGAHRVLWNGLDNSGNRAPAGLYKLVVNAVDEQDASITATIVSTVRVEAVSFLGSDTTLETSAGAAPFSAVRRVDAPSE